MLKNYYDSNNHLPSDTDRNALFESPSINMCINGGQNQAMSPAAKLLLELHFRFGHHNLHDTQIILLSPLFGKDKFISSSRIPYEQCPKYEVCRYAKEKIKALHRNKTPIDVAQEGSLRDNHLLPGYSVYVNHF